MKRFIGYLIGTLIILILWHLGSILLNKPFLPTPVQSFLALKDALIYGDLDKHFLISSFRIITSLLLSLLLAVPLGLFLGQNPKWDNLTSPIIYMLYPLPKVVFLPIIVVLMGIGNLPKIFLITLVIFFQILVVAKDTAKSIPLGNIQSMRLLKANFIQTHYHLIIPYCLPKILTSLRITLGTAIAILFFAETFASFDGLGYFILNGMESREYPSMYAGIISLAFLGIFLYFIVDLLEQRLCRWQRY